MAGPQPKGEVILALDNLSHLLWMVDGKTGMWIYQNIFSPGLVGLLPLVRRTNYEKSGVFTVDCLDCLCRLCR